MIIIDNLSKAYGRLEVLKDTSLHINRGDIFAIVGRSGAGKSTLLRCINGLEKYDSGSLKVGGIEVGALSKKDMRMFRRNIGMVFQNFSLMTRATVYDNIAFAMDIWKSDKKLVDKRVKELLEVVEIPEKINCKARELSGGQKQRVAIARALAMNPSVLLCDEATSALDPKSTTAIISLLNEINKKLGITIVMVTHEMDVVKSLCDSMAIIEDGELKSSGLVDKVFLERPQALSNLLGNRNILIPREGCSIEITYDSTVQQEFLISDIARQLNISFRVLENETLVLKNKNINSVVINVEHENTSKVCDYLDRRCAVYKRLEGGK